MISIIVVNWNGKHHLDTCLSSLFRQTCQDFEIIVVDNGSTDGSVAFIRHFFPAVRVIALDRNSGFCEGNNTGIKAARGDLIVTLNNDTEADRRWLEALMEASTRHPEVGCFASKMLFFQQRSIIDDAGDEFHTAGFAAKRGWLRAEGPPYDVESEVFGACAGAALYRKVMLDEIGLFDESFFANGEDVDLSFRARLKGYKCLYVPQAIVYHKVGASIGQNPEWFYWMRRNQLWILIKNMPGRLLVKYMPLILAYNLLSLAYHSFRGRGRLIWRAYFDAFRALPSVLIRRKQIQSRRTASLKEVDRALTKGKLGDRIFHPVTKTRAMRDLYKLPED